MSCRTGCPTQDHDSWGACLRAANLNVAYCQHVKGLDATAQKKWDKELDLYASARAQGIQPATTKTSSIRHSLDMSDKYGKPFDASRPEGMI